MENGALDAYLLWEFSRKTVQDTLETSPVKTCDIVRSMNLAREVLTGLSHGKVLTGLSHGTKIKMTRLFSPSSQRARLLEEKHWTLEEYPVSQLGTVLPRVGDLPPEVITKSFVAVGGYVRQNLESDSSSIKYIRALSSVASILETIPVTVVEPGSEQRRPDVMISTWGNRDWEIYPAKGYIEDGNHRALALADPNRTTIPSYVGRAA